MSIVKEYNKFKPTCDICGNELEPYYDFDDAVAGKKLAGWKSVKINGEWEDHCQICQSIQLDWK